MHDKGYKLRLQAASGAGEANLVEGGNPYLWIGFDSSRDRSDRVGYYSGRQGLRKLALHILAHHGTPQEKTFARKQLPRKTRKQELANGEDR